MIVKNIGKVFVGLFLLFAASAYGQDAPQEPPTLTEQFRELINDSETFKQYKVIPISELNSFWNVVEDSLASSQLEFTSAQNIIDQQKNEIANLNEKIEEQQVAVDEATYDREHISVLGINFSKDLFIIISFSIIGALLVLLIVGLGKYKRNERIAAEKVREYNKLEKDYKDYQDKAREKQMKTKRELQTYMNKLEELKHKNISFK